MWWYHTMHTWITRRCISCAPLDPWHGTILIGYDTICTTRNRVQKEVPNGPLSKVRSKSLLGVHSPDEVMTPFGRWCLEDISDLMSRVWLIPLTSLQSGGGGEMVVCTTCTPCTRRVLDTLLHTSRRDTTPDVQIHTRDIT